MKSRLLTLLIALIPVGFLFAQEGNFLLTHHVPQALGLDHANFDVLYDQSGLVNVANRQGVLRYDGHMWDMVSTPMAVLALAEGPDGTLYAAGEGDFGKVSYTESGEYLYQSLRKESGQTPKTWHDVAVLNHKVYFLSANEIVAYDPTGLDAPLVSLPAEGLVYEKMFSEPHRLLIETAGQGLFSIADDGFNVDSVNILPDSAGQLILSIQNKLSGQSLYGTHQQLWLTQGDSLVPAFTDLDSLLRDGWMLSAAWVQDSLIAVGTLNQGVLFLNPRKGTLVQHINYHTGLPDNEVLGLEVDADGGVWVVHEFGLSRVSPSLPIRSFAHYPGLEGNLLAVKRHQGTLYVATSLGVFYLDQVNNFRETVYYVRKQIERRPGRTHSAPVRQTPIVQNPDPPSGSGILSGLFSQEGRQTRQQRQAARQAQREQQREQRNAERLSDREQEEEGFLQRVFGRNDDQRPQTRYERRVRRELVSVRYVFKKVEGIDAKCKHLVSFGDRLLVGSHSGVYEVSGGKAVMISDQPVQYLYATRNQQRVVLSTLYDEVIILEAEEDIWLEQTFPNLHEPVVHINEDDEHLWLVSPDHVLRYTWGDTTFQYNTYAVPNPNYEPMYAVRLGEAMYFVNGVAYHKYDPAADKMVLDEAMAQRYGLPQEYHYSEGNRMWVYDGKQWEEISATDDVPNLDYLLLFEHIQHLSIDEATGYLWVTTPDEEMYQYNFRDSSHWRSVHELVLKGIRGQGDTWLPLGDFVINKENSFVQFEFTRPDFLGRLGIEYRYRLSGLGNEWSAWDDNNIVTFNYLPPGNYTLAVQARDAFGHENEPYEVGFKVVPPWWEQGWFYASEAGFFLFILLLSHRINRTKIRTSFVSRVLTYLTLILVIEFLQNLTKTQLTLGNNPIVELLVEAAIAFSLLPLEMLLRKFMVASASKSEAEAASPTA